MENRILINDNKHFAEAKTKELEAKAVTLTALVAYYNELPVIAKLEKPDQVWAFLKDPLNYFESAILKTLDVGSKTPPKVDAVAALMGIPYAPVIDRIVKARISNLDLFELQVPENRLYLSDKAIADIYEAVKEYTRDEVEAEAWNRTKLICDMLNSYIEDFGLRTISPEYRISKDLGLSLKGEVGYSLLIPDIYKIRQLLSFPDRRKAFTKKK